MKYIKGGENVVADALSRSLTEGEISPKAKSKLHNSSSTTKSGNVLAIELGNCEPYITAEDFVKVAVRDDFYQMVLLDEDLQDQLGVTESNGLLLTARNQLLVPEDDVLRFKIVLEHHDQPFYGHWSVDKTLHSI